MVEKNNAQLAEVLYRNLKGKRYLIVMDDMWSIDAWNDIRRCFPDDKNGSRIVVTSRVTKLAVFINPNKPPHFMNLLDDEPSTVSSIPLLRLIEETDSSLACEVGDFIEAVKKGSDAEDVLIAIKQRILSFTSSNTTSATPQFQLGKQIVAIPEIVEAEQIVADIKFFEEKLGNFLHSIDQDIHVNPKLKGLRAWFTRVVPILKGLGALFTWVITDLISESVALSVSDFHPTLPTLDVFQADSKLPFPPIVCAIQKLCTKCQRLRDTIVTYVEAAAETTDLHQDLLFLLNLLKEDPSNHKCCHDHELLKQVKDVADRVRDLVEEHMVDNQIHSAMKYTFWLLGILPQLPLYTEDIEHAVEEIFNGEKGIGQCLEQASKEIELIKEISRRINEETPSLQTSISNISLDHSNREDIVVGLDGELIRLLEDLTRIPSGLEIVTIWGWAALVRQLLVEKLFIILTLLITSIVVDGSAC